MFHIYQLTKGNFDDSEPAWCPDGSVIAFSSNRKSDIGSSGLEAGTEKQRGNLPRVIFFVSTSPRPVLTLARGGFSILESPAWLPGGRNLVFVSSARPGTQSGKSEPSIHLLTGARN